MRTDSLFYRLFETSPETLFLVCGSSLAAARELASMYQYEAVEFKETSHRTDGVFRPKTQDLPLYFVEVQFYRKPIVYADLLAKAYTYLKQHDPGQSFFGIVLFATRALEPTILVPYQHSLDARVLQRFYLDELPDSADGPLGLEILNLIGQSESQSMLRARDLVARAKKEIADEALQADLVELIQTVIVYKLSDLSREEIQAMLQVSDIRETRVYREAKEEGLHEGIEQGIEQGIKKGIEKERQRSIAKMAAMKLSAEEIADLLGVDLVLVNDQLARLRP